MFRFGIALAGGLAVVMIIVGGVEYVSTDAWGKKDDGKKRITAAITGLVVALGSYALLNTLSPDLLSTKLKLETVGLEKIPTTGGVTPTTPTGGTTGQPNPDGTTGTPAASGKSEQELRDYFAQNGININSNPCPAGQTQGCSNVAGLGDAAVTGLVDLKKNSGADITISGGTEEGHKTHGVGQPIVDVRKNSDLDSYVAKNTVNTEQTTLGPKYTTSNGTTFLNEGDHWHVVFK